MHQIIEDAMIKRGDIVARAGGRCFADSTFSMSLFWRQFCAELHKLFARKRTHIGFVALLVAELILLALLQVDTVRNYIRQDMLRAGASFAADFSGVTVAEYMMSNTMSSLGNLFIALVAGDIVAKEVEDGTLRTTFCRPVSRGAVFVHKYLVVLLYTVCVVGFLGVSALLIGLLFEGPGNVFFWSVKEGITAWFAFWPGLARYTLALPLLTLSVFSVTTLAFTFSCCNVKPAAAAALALTFFLVDDALRNVPQFRSAKEYFVMTRIVAWVHVYDEIIPWPYLRRNYSILLAGNAGLLAVAYAQFRRRDLKP